MKLLITGATGFVGRHVVAAAVGRGHEVRAVVRPASTATPPIEVARVDLRSPSGLGAAVAGVDTVVHLAATKAGDFTTQFAGTVVATENLLAAMADRGVNRLVGVSTFSVYDYRRLSTGELLTEESPIDLDPARRDEYAQTKLLQERLFRQWRSTALDRRVVVLRPGMIYGPDNLWHALLGSELGPRYLRIGSAATLPLTYVENCADAIVDAAEKLSEDRSAVDGETINIVDDDLPTQERYVELVSEVIDAPESVTVPWPVVRAAASVVGRANEVLVGGRAKFPGIMVSERLHARFKPLRYTNEKAKRLLGWSPRYTTAEAIERSGRRDDG